MSTGPGGTSTGDRCCVLTTSVSSDVLPCTAGLGRLGEGGPSTGPRREPWSVKPDHQPPPTVQMGRLWCREQRSLP